MQKELWYVDAMRVFGQSACLLAATLALFSTAGNAQEWLKTDTSEEIDHSPYYWKSVSAGDSAQLLTLFCRGASLSDDPDLPVISVLRDTLGDSFADNDRVTSVWLLTYSAPTIAQRALSAVPFFYWRVGAGSGEVSSKNVKPLMDLTTPERPVVSGLARNLLQWTTLDSAAMPVRASSRAYRANDSDNERLHLEEAIRYLRQAPPSYDEKGLTPDEINTVVARLELRKRLLGGLASTASAEHLGAKQDYEDEQVRSRNWELLRQCAEKTGLVFQSIKLGGDAESYAILWFPVAQKPPDYGTNVSPIWKILNLRDPWTDDRLKHWRGPVFTGQALRFEDSDNDRQPAETQTYIPLGVYSVRYPKVPLLLIDFRDRLHLRRHEMTQRTINEVTSGVIGISHFTNWYYYVAADLYDFYAGRHGGAVDQSERLDCYSQFRAALALDRNLDSELRRQMQERVNNLSLNPLEAGTKRELELARQRYAVLVAQSEPGGMVVKRLNETRRAEIADFGKTRTQLAGQLLLHYGSFGLYTPHVGEKQLNLSTLDANRRVEHDLQFLTDATANGTQPEVAYDVTRLRQRVSELRSLLPGVNSAEVRHEASNIIERVQRLSKDDEVQADCRQAIAAISLPDRVDPAGRNKPGVAAAIKTGLPEYADSTK